MIITRHLITLLEQVQPLGDISAKIGEVALKLDADSGNEVLLVLRKLHEASVILNGIAKTELENR